MLYRLLRPALFALEAERAHGLAVRALAAVQAIPGGCAVLALGARPSERLRRRVGGLDLRAPVGLAAGFDKDARLVRAMAALGAGSVEVGTVTPRPQAGNPRPRMFRYPGVHSLQNRLGFNSAGLDAVEANLRRASPHPVTVGINVGKNKTTPNTEAQGDYLTQIERLRELGDYFVVNVSSPNTPGLRELQEAETLARLLGEARRLTARPILVKIAPDLDHGAARELAAAVLEAGAAGLVATNTTVDASGVAGARAEGGISGAALTERSRAMLRALAPTVAGRGILVSVGGISTAEEAYARLRAGADWVQLYSALVFEGPRLFARLHRDLLRLMDRDGAATLDDVVGADREAAA